MGRHAGMRPGPSRPAAGLRVLAELINDVLASAGAQPAFAIAGRPGPDRPLLVEQSAVESTRSVSRSEATSTQGGQAGNPRPAGTDTEPPDQTAVSRDVTDVDETHAETWHFVRLAQEGDGEAFGRLYDRYVDMVFRFIYFRVNDRALAEDFTSETFLRALRRIGTITYQGRDIGAWFITIARNIVLDHVKSARNRLETTTADTFENKEHVGSTEEAVLDLLQSERLMQAVGQLGDEQRECIMLRFIHGLSVSETAQIMGKNDGAIKALQHRAVRKLADLVGGDLR